MGKIGDDGMTKMHSECTGKLTVRSQHSPEAKIQKQPEAIANDCHIHYSILPDITVESSFTLGAQ